MLPCMKSTPTITFPTYSIVCWTLQNIKYNNKYKQQQIDTKNRVDLKSKFKLTNSASLCSVAEVFKTFTHILKADKTFWEFKGFTLYWLSLTVYGRQFSKENKTHIGCKGSVTVFLFTCKLLSKVVAANMCVKIPLV